MRASRLMVFLYAAMVGIPLLLFFSLLLSLSGFKGINPSIELLLALGFLTFGTLGAWEIFVHKQPKQRLELGKSEELTRVMQEKSPASQNGSNRQAMFVIRRFNNATKALEDNLYKINVTRFTTVLDALLHVKTKEDNTLAVRYSCRMGICGSCGVVVNGKPTLACETNFLDCMRNESVEVSPMLGHPLLKDLVTDFDEFFDKHKSVQPSLMRHDSEEKYEAKEAYVQSKEQQAKFLPYSYCIMCGLCLDACPVVNSNPEFVGPQALSQAYRYLADSRDEGGRERLQKLDLMSSVWGCEFAGSCSKACPKGVDPASAIQLLKGELLKDLTYKEQKKT